MAPQLGHLWRVGVGREEEQAGKEEEQVGREALVVREEEQVGRKEETERLGVWLLYQNWSVDLMKVVMACGLECDGGSHIQYHTR